MTPSMVPLRQWRRLQEIATVLWSSGFGWLVVRWALGLRLAAVPRGLRHRCAELPAPRGDGPAARARAALVLRRLRPTFVKVGQLLATRTDYLPTAYAEALTSLLDDVSPFPGASARHVVAEKLQGPLDDVFGEFDAVRMSGWLGPP